MAMEKKKKLIEYRSRFSRSTHTDLDSLCDTDE